MHMKVTLISVPPNRVIDVLLQHNEIELIIENPALISNKKRTEWDFDGMLLTYRCPKIIPKEVYSLFRLGAYNLHPSLLPLYPGLNPWEQIFADRISMSGVTLHKLSNVVDGGEIIIQSSFEITKNDTLTSARNKADAVASKIIVEFINNLL